MLHLFCSRGIYMCGSYREQLVPCASDLYIGGEWHVCCKAGRLWGIPHRGQRPAQTDSIRLYDIALPGDRGPFGVRETSKKWLIINWCFPCLPSAIFYHNIYNSVSSLTCICICYVLRLCSPIPFDIMLNTKISLHIHCLLFCIFHFYIWWVLYNIFIPCITGILIDCSLPIKIA